MIPTSMSYAMWARVKSQVQARTDAERFEVSKHDLPHPLEAGARVSVGFPLGQRADYRFPPDNACRGLHVQDFGDRWVIHVDVVHPACDLLDHIRLDAPDAWQLGGALMGAVLGAVLGRNRLAMVAGAGIGCLIARALLPDDATRLGPSSSS